MFAFSKVYWAGPPPAEGSCRGCEWRRVEGHILDPQTLTFHPQCAYLVYLFVLHSGHVGVFCGGCIKHVKERSSIQAACQTNSEHIWKLSDQISAGHQSFEDIASGGIQKPSSAICEGTCNFAFWLLITFSHQVSVLSSSTSNTKNTFQNGDSQMSPFSWHNLQHSPAYFTTTWSCQQLDLTRSLIQ